ncbi:bifunctional glutamate N-acetyltransferase/amino-acid acetyltransferase ArgJ [Halorhodospira halochloris]|uniref:Arginine biosynthesis bifunctional protein ArgJ n=1 Tax=Halorhodospira halochloris TaxID=1052 RepID=A0A0X8XBB6_HALHR|nr:bifunctional glutamate N-acetyltransferase/amino-acid acetyltransferase ArgJ [Halorhodospira halochloris]MBK1652140.1 bifunctional ornithine acetyltransferase/N-acetylglutamate synthase [Halorhodospira halochloris]MCG5530568.1 bifunctional glutamate N-acetyltransferase/amino-acid acetyltransferase ArgJ [Halorhodospira halochloris]MCG5547850.1 bifunctional glutamate N-acetyltransferase/amino-acid acetyltransferase ArgJ [Halorhodospira halochloris]BAU58442.1 glutamate N-acetyltransferase [Halo
MSPCQHSITPQPVAGVRVGSVCAGIRQPGRPDLTLIELAAGSKAGAVFTRNQFRAAPVWIAERHLSSNAPRYLLINTGYANAGTGERGEPDALACCRAVADNCNCAPEQVIPFSTGIIGEPLPVERVAAAIPNVCADLREDGWEDAAWAIHTTDTRAKQVSLHFELSGGPCTITGIAKGAGMIRPNMATMLAFIATDAGLSDTALDRALRHSVGLSFNRVSVDGDTSTNDACLLAATGVGPEIEGEGADFERFQAALDAVCIDLAKAIAADGEGASRLVEVEVRSAVSSAEAEQVAFTVAESPLVKTALAAADPNWGRVLAAVGRAGIADLDVNRLRLFFGEQLIAEHGGRSNNYDEAAAAAELARPQVAVTIDLQRGNSNATVWTCDLTAEYVRINAEYRS